MGGMKIKSSKTTAIFGRWGKDSMAAQAISK